MALRDLTDPAAVVAAMDEHDVLGESAFLAKYGFRPSTRHKLDRGDGRTYASKAVLAAAHGVQHPELGPLKHDDLSGGEQVLEKARALGFAVVRVDGGADELGLALARFMTMLVEARDQSFSHAHAAVDAVKRCAELIEDLLPESLSGAKVRPSVGQGNWASVPWIAVLHPGETTTTQRGVYPVLLFHEDLQSVEVTIAQGVTELNKGLGRRAAVTELDRRATIVRGELDALADVGYDADSDYDLGRSSLARDYVASTVVHKRFARDELGRSSITDDLTWALELYGELLSSGQLARLDQTDVELVTRRALMIYVGQAASTNFESGGRDGWWGWREAPEGLEELRPGDLIAFGRGYSGGSPRVDVENWQANHLTEVVVGRILQTPQRTDRLVMPDELAGTASYPFKIRFEHLGANQEVTLRPGDQLSQDAGEALRRSAAVRGIGVLVPVAGSPLLEAYVNSEVTQPPAQDVGEVAAAFAAAVETSGLRLPSEDVRAFLAALLAKPFSILTGQSGSGKTQLAKRLGEWLGSDDANRPRYHVVPVRPDWTGPEYLFGYPDALRSTAQEAVWAVPDTLEFMLRAAGEPDAPYLLVLDEMNLAHVERYFADFLSGVESREPVLPELTQIAGRWTSTGNSQRQPLPRNLFVIGTVNVDETTYLFSPKVLDRAFTFEFRTAAADLDPHLRRPTSIGPAQFAELRTLVEVAGDDNWQHAHPHPELDALAEDLREIHGLLSPSGHDFGHRVLYESLRFAALLAGTGTTDRWSVLDRIVLTKVLPKMHGTRARIERPLVALREYCDGGAPPGEGPRMPLTAAKLDRMLDVLVQAQFVSFTE